MTAARRPDDLVSFSSSVFPFSLPSLPPPPPPPRSHPFTGTAFDAPKQSQESRPPSLSPTTARARVAERTNSAAAEGSPGSRLATRAQARAVEGPEAAAAVAAAAATSQSLRQRSAPAERRKRDDEEERELLLLPKATAATRAACAPTTRAEGEEALEKLEGGLGAAFFEPLFCGCGGGGGQPLTTTTALWQARARAEPSGDQEAAEEVYLGFCRGKREGRERERLNFLSTSQASVGNRAAFFPLSNQSQRYKNSYQLVDAGMRTSPPWA